MIDNRFLEVCNENKELKARVYRATRGDYIFGRVAQVLSLYDLALSSEKSCLLLGGRTRRAYAMFHLDQISTVIMI